MNTSQNTTVDVIQPSLPKGGGAIQGMGEALASVGLTGMASRTLALPIAAGRGFAPPLSLNYSSSAGNGAFAMGWGLSEVRIRRRTAKGVPLYGESDEYLAPNGDVLVPEAASDGTVLTRQCSSYAGLDLGQTYRVTRYLPRIESSFSRIERWSPTSSEGDFWLLHTAEGYLHCLGKSTEARIADPAHPDHIAVWLLEESVTPAGEHICYRYQQEDTANCVLTGQEACRSHTANRYLQSVDYGNVDEYRPLYTWGKFTAQQAPTWLWTLVFDYGERTLDPLVRPAKKSTSNWLCRQDAFSNYSFGFEVRTHRLCHQVLMFRHLAQRADSGLDPDILVSRLLLEYQSSPLMSQLVGAQVLGYSEDGQVKSLPPVDFTYDTFTTEFSPSHYAQLPSFPSLNDGQRYQLVDLWGEGLCGILYQEGNDWRYRAPIRAAQGGESVDYAPWQALPQLPSMLSPQGGRQALVDIKGTGRLDWLVAQPNLAGYFALNDQHWGQFIPFPAFPTEFLHSSAQLASLVGSGLPDLVLIGPKSVRVYANSPNIDDYGPVHDAPHEGDDSLPIQTGDRASLVAFSDVLGSGQQHLVQIRYNQLTCWPNLGRGTFGKPLVLAQLPFDQTSFNPVRVFLADLDGSGAADLIYAEADRFLIFLNQSGNAFSQAPLVLPMPEGVRFEQLDQVSFADLNGTGTASLILTVSHIQPRHWHYNFSASKPYLLLSSNNNMGTHTSVTYRSSAQEWLDEKQASPDRVCQLPFAMPVVSTQSLLDEITGNCLMQQYAYRAGIYVEREFRGFGFVQHLDTQHLAQPSASGLPVAAPRLTKVWYHTGLANETLLGARPYQDDSVFSLGESRLTRFNPVSGHDELPPSLSADTRRQLYRALQGQIQRTEIYGDDASPLKDVPYSVQTMRLQVRLIQESTPASLYCVALPMTLEQLNVTYERIADDPRLEQQVTLQSDEYATPVWSVAVNYPRRPKPDVSPYPDTVPSTLWGSTYDAEQTVLRLTESRTRAYNLSAPEIWTLGLPYQQRRNVLTCTAVSDGYPLTGTGLSYESLSAPTGLIDKTQARTFAGQTVTYYFNAAGTDVLPEGTLPPALALVHHQEVAELDAESLKAYDDVASLDLNVALPAAGYVKRSKVLGEPAEPDPEIWTIPGNYSTYVENGEWLPFARPRATQSTPLTTPHVFTYDGLGFVSSITDGTGYKVSLAYDPLWLKPSWIEDANQSSRGVSFDNLGQVAASSHNGSEINAEGASVSVGFAPAENFVAADNPALATIKVALADPTAAIGNMAGVYLYEFASWMGSLSTDDLAALAGPGQDAALMQVLQSNHFLTFDGWLRSRAHAWARSPASVEGLSEAVRDAIAKVERDPIHTAALLADQYALSSPDATSAVQIRISLSYFDGFGRTLQAKQKCAPGLAYVANPDGTLLLEAGQPVERDTGTASRWAVSGRTEYDNKGQAIRTYPPYFVDQPIYINDADVRQWGYADTHYYDPVGREHQVMTALGYLRRAQFYPWFTVTEDENDTLQEIMNSAQAS
ncbi:hypothetical protein J3D48_006300 [Pseudomonas fluorescens]|uniref:SpvB/TcaC N-terminal domain-containing protein n=1 Tax=Pseudomonas fluorescens TaxID=294 RepID=UPI0020A0D449|nr:SpvB/TcaC N-terminal domain-containing protein [Pseudomonas fluorescens]MCP1489890.1 hypothetical protein [Pseudomonas fluorescens]